MRGPMPIPVDALMYGTAIGMAVLALIYPICALVFMTRPKVVAAYAGGRGQGDARADADPGRRPHVRDGDRDGRAGADLPDLRAGVHDAAEGGGGVRGWTWARRCAGRCRSRSTPSCTGRRSGWPCWR